MFDSRSLKPSRKLGADRVECPVLDCTRRVDRQRRVFLREERFRCPEHDIYISPSTYEHKDFRDNLLYVDQHERSLLRHIFAIKRDNERFGRERSEDALTFNVFRTLELENFLDPITSTISGRPESGATPSYWCYSIEAAAIHPLLASARLAFGEVTDHGTEPDLMIETQETLFLVEAKLGASNDTSPSRPWVLNSYRQAEHGWYERVFNSGPAVVAQEHRLYQLMRLWLLGTWMAHRARKRLVLVNLCPATCEREIESRFFPHIITNDDARFVRATWEGVAQQISATTQNPGLARLVDYLEHKTMGYDRTGSLCLAFGG